MSAKIARTTRTAGVALVVSLGVFFGIYTSADKSPEIVYSVMQYPADFSKDREVVAYADNVFVAHVLRQVGTESYGGSPFPYTQYEVEILQFIKGQATSRVIVNQRGGYRDGVLHLTRTGAGLTAEDSPLGAEQLRAIGATNLLVPGMAYVMAVLYDPANNRYNLFTHYNGSKQISTDPSLTFGQLQAIAVADEKVLSFQNVCTLIRC